MKPREAVVHRLSDYQVPDFLIEHVNLTIDLTANPPRAKSRLTIKPNPESKKNPADITLDGENMRLLSVALNGTELDANNFILTDHALTIKNVGELGTFTLESETELGQNDDLFGLYKTEGTWLVKAETEGLRRVLYCLDRPDVMATYTTTILANKDAYPQLLSNGKLIHSATFADGTHTTTWEDTTPKPSYLFAMVAGNFVKLATEHVTQSGKSIPIEFYVHPSAQDKCEFAMEILKLAMQWEEEVYGLECELPVHKVTGVEKYASGASEPTGLNLFNLEFLLATIASKTDSGFLRVAETVSHEYFHYRTGNRTTIREWFNLTFKEGLTTSRAREFLDWLFGETNMLLFSGKLLEKDAPRPDTYTKVRSLYTRAAYDKSALIFRMIKKAIGEDVYHQGLSHFLKEHDGQAVTLEQLLTSLSEFSGVDVTPWLIWFTQPGVPTLKIEDVYNEKTGTYTLTIKQTGLPEGSKPLPIPFKLSLFSPNGTETYKDSVIHLDQFEQSITFHNIKSRPVPSLLRDFSAPVDVDYTYQRNDLLLLMQHDSSLFNRKEAAEALLVQYIKEHCKGNKLALDPAVFSTYRSLVQDKSIHPWALSSILTVPSETKLISLIKDVNLDDLHEAREFVLKSLATELIEPISERLDDLFTAAPPGISPMTNFDFYEASQRRLNDVFLQFLSKSNLQEAAEIAEIRFNCTLRENMSETVSALEILIAAGGERKEKAVKAFKDYWGEDNSAMNNLLKLEGASDSPDTVQNVRNILFDLAFDLFNPTKVFSLLSTFLTNTQGFHAKSGEGYRLLTDVILAIETKNPTVAARLVPYFNDWEKYDNSRQQLMFGQLTYLKEHAKSVDVLEALKPIMSNPTFQAKLTAVSQLGIFGGTGQAQPALPPATSYRSAAKP